jgi:hypothetical protein
MTLSKRFLALALMGICLTLAGCAGVLLPPVTHLDKDPSPSMDLAQAKQQTLTWTSTLVAAVPQDGVAASWQHEEGVLLSCARDAFQWAGAAEITLKDEQDLMPLLEMMSAAWIARTRLPSSLEKSGSGGPRLVVSGPDGASIIIDGYDDGRTIALSSFSPCVTDLADYDGGYSY